MSRYEITFNILRKLEETLKSKKQGITYDTFMKEIMNVENTPIENAKKVAGNHIHGDLRFMEKDEKIHLRTPDYGINLLKNEEFIVFDLETTGIGVGQNKITEIGCVKIKNGEIIDKFETLVNPEMEISERVTKITGITNDMVKSAPSIKDTLNSFSEFIKDTPLVAHNASFDIAFINYERKLLDMVLLTNPLICSVKLAHKAIPELNKYNLDILAEHFNITIENRHRSMGDVLATTTVFNELRKIYLEKFD